MPTNILHINPNAEKGIVLWYTKAQQRQLYFVDSLGISNGIGTSTANALVSEQKQSYCICFGKRQKTHRETPLHYAPFFNIYEKGNVCMGTVSIDIKNSASVEEFTQAWEHYFFNSYFSHSLCENLTKKNIVNLWKDLINTDKPFPKEVLKKNNKTLKNLL